MTDRRQRQKEARAAAKEAERKAASRRELRRRIVTGLGLGGAVALVLVLISLSGSGEEEVPAGLAAFRAQDTACGGEVPDPITELQFDAPSDQGIGSDASVTATIQTSCGAIVVELDPSYPETVNSFVFLAREGYYDGTAVHRISSGFVFQGGDPSATGRGGPGYTIPDEFPEDGFVYETGVVAMANAGRGTTGSQFFVVTGDRAEVLAPTFNVVGRVVEGMDVAMQIDGVSTRLQPGGREESYPTESVYIESVTIDVAG